MLVDWTAGVELALRLEPRTQRVVFVGGTGPTERVWEGLARQAFSKFENRVTFSSLSGHPMSEILTAVATLPKGTVVVLGAFLRDGAGRTFTTQEALSLLAGASTAPIYSFGESLLGHGIVGGPLISFDGRGVKAAELGLRFLNGQRLGPADVVSHHANRYMFDSRQLRRWGLSESRLPPGSVVLFREPSVWDVYKWYIVAAVALSVIQTLLIAGLLLERRQRKQAQRRLDERLRFETVVSELSAGFMKIRADEVDQQIGHGLRRIVEELGVDRARIGELMTAERPIRITHSWTTEGIAPIPLLFAAGEVPRIAGRLVAC